MLEFQIPQQEKLRSPKPEQGFATFYSPKGIPSLLTYQKVQSLVCDRQVLLGDVKKVRIKGKSQKTLKENLKTAKKLIKLVEECKIHSFNFPKRTKYQGSMEELKTKQLFVLEKASSHKAYMAAIKELNVGNCQELALFGINQYYNEINPKTSLEIAGVDEGNHIFILIGRSKSSTLSSGNSYDPTSDECGVICDPWTNSYFPAKFYQKYFYSYAGLLVQGPSSSSDNPTAYSTLVSRLKENSKIEIYTNREK